MRRETAALPVPPVRATDLWGTLWWLQEDTERYVFPSSPPWELLVLAKASGEVFTLGVTEILETYFVLSEKKPQSLRIPIRRGECSHTKPRCWWQEQDSAYRSLKIGYKSQTSPTWMVWDKLIKIQIIQWFLKNAKNHAGGVIIWKRLRCCEFWSPTQQLLQTTSSRTDLSQSEKKVFFKDIFILGIINLSEK